MSDEDRWAARPRRSRLGKWARKLRGSDADPLMDERPLGRVAWHVFVFFLLIGCVAVTAARAQPASTRMTEEQALEQMGEFAALALVTEFGERRCSSVPRVQWRLRNGDVAEWRGPDDVRWLAERAAEYREAIQGIHRALLQRYPGRQAVYAAEMTRAEPRMMALLQQVQRDTDGLDRAVGGRHGGCFMLMRVAIENRRPIPSMQRLGSGPINLLHGFGGL